MSSATPHTVVIGAGIGGLTAAALLIKAGHRVTVLEAQTYPGGSAGTFTYQGYRFDAGATLAGGFAPGGPHYRLAELLGLEWPIKPVDPAWVVHLPDGRTVTQWADHTAWQSERIAAFPNAEAFWHKQEMLSNLSWDISSRHFPWPPQKPGDLLDLTLALRPRTLRAMPYILRTMADIMPDSDPLFRTFIDANLLISAQTTAENANALYGSAALDLPRRGVNTVRGGIGALAQTLVDWIQANGGTVHFKQKVGRIDVRNGKAVAIHANLHSRNKRSQRTFTFDNLLANLTPWSLKNLLGDNAPEKMQRTVDKLEPTWGAFMLYLGVAADALPADVSGHYQVIGDHARRLGETNSIFISMSPVDDDSRAPTGMRAVNISTHTDIAAWWALRNDPNRKAEYHERRDQYTEQMIALTERALPGFKQAIRLTLPATPVTYAHWTGREQGMVGGFPQSSILQARGPRTALENVWLVGDSIFPGQSTAGVTLGGMRVAQDVINAEGRFGRISIPRLSFGKKLQRTTAETPG